MKERTCFFDMLNSAVPRKAKAVCNFGPSEFSRAKDPNISFKKLKIPFSLEELYHSIKQLGTKNHFHL